MTYLYKVKTKLTGSTFTDLMKRKKTNKYRIARSTGISYPTLSNWEAGRQWPRDDTAEAVAKYLGLIADDDQIVELERQQEEIKEKLRRLSGRVY